MRTVNEIAKITGISRRAIRYYDQIGLLAPTKISESGYRLYDDKALDTLQQILLFKELDVPLKDIKSVLDNPNLDRINLLKSHQELLSLKRDHLTDLIKLIDKIIKEPRLMIFAEFNIQRLEQALECNLEVLKNSNEEVYKKMLEESNGDPKVFIEKALAYVRENPESINALYGNLENYINILKKSKERSSNAKKYGHQLGDTILKLSQIKDKDISCSEVQELVAEIDDLNVKISGVDLVCEENSAKMFREAMKENPDKLKEYEKTKLEVKERTDKAYGEGFYDFYRQAIEYYVAHKK